MLPKLRSSRAHYSVRWIEPFTPFGSSIYRVLLMALRVGSASVWPFKRPFPMVASRRGAMVAKFFAIGYPKHARAPIQYR